LLGIDNSFEFIFLVGFVAGSVIRKIYTFRCREGKAVRQHKDIVDITLISAGGLGMVLPLFYIFTPWLDFADYHLPEWLRWIGTAVFAMALLLLWRSHADLGRNFSAILQIRREHLLVTDGIYRHIRHPMYLIRAPKEEQMMLEQFDEQYRRYFSRTGGIIPRFWK
jgi:protein-S-isoprenylcysteine O-methyltransferase Ste14